MVAGSFGCDSVLPPGPRCVGSVASTRFPSSERYWTKRPGPPTPGPSPSVGCSYARCSLSSVRSVREIRKERSEA